MYIYDWIYDWRHMIGFQFTLPKEIKQRRSQPVGIIPVGKLNGLSRVC